MTKKTCTEQRKIDNLTKSLDTVCIQDYNIRAVNMILRLKSALNICFSGGTQ